jgi:hypothetical protein
MMAGYRGDGYGAYGDHGDDDYRFGDDRERSGRGRGQGFMFGEGDEPRQGSAHGNVMGRAEQRVRGWFEDDDRNDNRGESSRLADDPRAVRASNEWRQRHGREGYEGSYAQHDDGYESFRQRHIAELDRDYSDWCREREQQFHSEFDNWRRQRRFGSPRQDQSSEPTMELTDADRAEAPAMPVTSELNATSQASSSSRRRSSSQAGTASGGK